MISRHDKIRLSRWPIAAALLCAGPLPPAFAAEQAAAIPAARLIAEDVRIDTARSPLGIDSPQPSISWRPSAGQPGTSQGAYQIQIASSAAGLAAGRADVWDSGRIASPMPRAVYAGRPLRARETLFVRVRLWDGHGAPTSWSAPASWEMGLLAKSDWTAQWIGAPGASAIPANYAGHYFRRAFDIPASVVSARLYVAGTGMDQNCLDRRTPQACRVAAGLLRPTLNGRLLSDRELDSAPSDPTRPLYTSLDVTRFLKRGPNALGVSVGGNTSFIAQLEITLAGGKRIVIGSDASWQTRASPYLKVDRFAGTHYDARLETEGWDEANFRPGAGWVPVEDRTQIVGAVTLSSDSSLPPMRVVKRWAPIAVTENAPGTYTFDFGQNISGRLRLRMRGEQGQAVEITHAEILNRKGQADKFSTGFLGLQTDRYVFGAADADWSPEFSYYGFRYVTVTGLRRPPKAGEMWAEQVNTDLERTGSFESSSDLLNRLHAAAAQTTLNNAHGIPEDCPHREKRGWSQDAYTGSPQAYANFDMEGFYAKWLRDAQDGQRPNGAGTDIAPVEVSYAVDGDSTWSSALVFVPWDLYRETGDLRYLERSYDSMRRLVEWEMGIAKDGLLPEGIYIGDWVAARQTDDGLLRNAIWFGVVDRVRESARLLGKTGDAARFGKLADDIRAKVNAKYLDAATGTYGTPDNREGSTSQVSMGVPLALGVVPDALRAKVAERLARYIAEVSKGHPESGLTATRFLLEGLDSADRPDLIHQMVTKKGAPGWAHMLEQGPGTMWEHWDGNGSRNHPWPGVIDAWFYRMYAGIVLGEPGYRTVIIKPYVPDDLEWVKASKMTPYGSLKSGWRKADGQLSLEVEVPPGVTATVLVPTRGTGGPAKLACDHCTASPAKSGAPEGFSAFEVGSGRYRFVSAGW